MRNRFKAFWAWAIHRPTVIINIIGLVILFGGAAGYYVYQQNRSIDVLQNWHVSLVPTETREVDGKDVAVYHPNDSLVFTSSSTKVADAQGTSSRMLVCPAQDGQARREIQLDTLPATRPAGVNQPAENAVTLPDVAQYSSLPRYCILQINIIYQDVNGTGRSWPERAETDPFIVEENVLNPAQIRKQIDELNDRIQSLEAQLSAATSSSSIQTQRNATGTSTPQSGTNTPSTGTNVSSGGTATGNSGTTTPPAPVDDGFQLHDIPVIGGLLGGLGL